MKELTHERVLELFAYDPDTGLLTRRVKKARQPVGSLVGSFDQDGYRHTKISGKMIRNHRLIVFYMTGRWPRECVDHINGIRDDNRWCNLRECSASANMQNTVARPGKAGFPGVTPRPSGNYVAKISKCGRTTYLGTFGDPAKAHEAYMAARAELHPFQPTPRMPVYVDDHSGH